MRKGFLLVWILAAVLISGAVLFVAVKSRSLSPLPSQPQASPSPSPVDETVNWETYQDEKYNFQFQYPSTVYLKKSPKFGDNIFLTENDIDMDKVQEGPFALITISIWNKNEFQKAGYPPQDKYLKKENIMIDGVDAVKVSGIITEDEAGLYMAGIYHQEVYFPIKDKIIHFVFYEDSSNNIKLLDQILSTFKTSGGEGELNKFKENRASARDIMRKADLATLLNAIYQYSQDNQGIFPSKISGKSQFIRTGEADICSDLVPKYFAVMSQDPSLASDPGKRFKSCGLNYDTGYTIVKDPFTGKITLRAPFAEQSSINVVK